MRRPSRFAYLRIGAAVGALVLFGVVQLTMVGYGIFRGERPTARLAGADARPGWLGRVDGAGGERPDPVGVALMAIAGVAWAVYTLAGKTVPDPIAANAWSFLGGSVLASLLELTSRAALTISTRGITLALISGGVTSGLGYAVWYRVLPRLSVMQAAISQLSVPVIAGAGRLLLHERWSARFVIAGATVLGDGVGSVDAAGGVVDEEWS